MPTHFTHKDIRRLMLRLNMHELKKSGIYLGIGTDGKKRHCNFYYRRDSDVLPSSTAWAIASSLGFDSLDTMYGFLYTPR